MRPLLPRPQRTDSVRHFGGKTIPVRFQGADGMIDRPRRGARYQAF